MLKGLGSLVARSLLLFLLSSPAWATNDTLFLNSQTGDTVGDGQQVTYTDSDGNFAAVPKSTNGITVTFTGSSPASTWTLLLAAPVAGTLAVGNYDDAQNPAFNPLLPSMSVIPASGYCESGITGRFVVRAITTDGSGNITSFAADFVQTCGEATGSLTGAIRFNSTIPVALDAPTADAGVNQLVQQGATVQLDGSLSLSGNGSITAYTWTQLSGPSVSLSDPTIVNPTFTAPDVALGGADVAVQLEVDNSLGLSSFSTVSVHIANPADPLTIFSLTVDPGASFTPLNLNALQAQFAVTGPLYGGSGVTFNVNNDPSVDFAAPTGQTLQVGTYDGAQRYPFQAPGLPGLAYGSCNISTGRFVILDLQRDGNGNITSFAADFDQHCEAQAPAAHGKIRFNSTVPLDAPAPDILPVVPMVQGETVTLSGTSWSTGTDGDDITSYQWTQISGPSVSLSDPDAPDPNFVAPDVALGGADLVFQLTVTNSLGISSSTTVTVHVANPNDSMTLLHVEVTPGGSQYEGASVTVTSAQESFDVFLSSTLTTGLGLQVMIGGYSTGAWDIGLTGPFNNPETPPQVGSYIVPVTLSVFGNVSVGGPVGLACNGGNLTARFTILDLQLGTNSTVTSVAADFDEYCSNSSAVLHGKLRYNSTVPLDTPDAVASGPQGVPQGTLVTLPGGTSYAGSDTESIASYQWMQLSGPSVTLSDPTAAAPTFTAPSIAVGGANLVFQLVVTNANGLTGTDQMTVHVYNPADPRNLLHITSDAGDPVGNGQTFDYNELNAVYNSAKPGYPYQGTTAGLVTVTYNQAQVPQSGQWTMEFAPFLNQALQTGSYDQAVNPYSFGSIAPQAGLAVGDAQSCFDLTGYFDILEIQTDQYGYITSLAADFVQTCSGATGSLHGQLRYNSSVPLNIPYADAGTYQIVDTSGTVTLGGSDSDAGADGATITSYQWVQVSGPSVTLSDLSGANPTFTSPNVPIGGADLVFQLTVTNSDGVSNTSTVTVHVENPGDPKTQFYAVSDPNDPVGDGQTYAFNTTNAVFSASAAASNGVANNSVTITANYGVEEPWQLVVAAPAGQALQVGTRYVLNPSLGSATPQPSLSVSPGFRDLEYESGFFVVRDLKTDSNGNITSFAADFVQCSDDTGPGCAALIGWVRYNSTVPMDIPLADSGGDQVTYSGFPITLDGSNSRSAPGVTLAYSWSQVVASGDPVVTLSDMSAAKPMFLAPEVPLGGRTLHFALTVTGSNGMSDTSTVAVIVGNEADAKSVFYFESDPGDPLGSGASGLITDGSDGDGGIDVSPYSTPSYAELDAYGDNIGGSGWDILLTPRYPLVLTSGMVYTSADGSSPYFSISSPGVTCNNPSSTFIVRDISTNSKGNIASLGVDFIAHCSGATGSMRGAFRFNSKTPILINEPTAAALNQNISQAGIVTLDGSTSFPGWGNIISYQWQQVSAPKVTLSNPATAIATFTASPSMLNNGGTTLVFKLTVKNSLGLSSSTNVTIRIAEPDVNLLYLQSDAGDPIGRGQTLRYAPVDTTMSVQDRGKRSVSASVHVDGDWMLDFVAPVHQTLQVGTYNNAVLYRDLISQMPTLYVGTAANQCKTVTGSFTVLEVIYGQANRLNALAMDFVQHCNGIGPALHGELRYHSTLP